MCFVLFCFEHDGGRLVGHRRQIGHIVQDPSNADIHIESEGYVFVAQKGKGLGHAISSATDNFLQSEANKIGLSIVWTASNKNLEQHNKDKELAVKMSKQFGSDLAEEFVNRSTKEQQRWQSLYSDSGLLGFKNLKKTYLPQDESGQMTKKSFYLAKKVGNKYEFIVKNSRESYKDKEKKFKKIESQINKLTSNGNK